MANIQSTVTTKSSGFSAQHIKAKDVELTFIISSTFDLRYSGEDWISHTKTQIALFAIFLPAIAVGTIHLKLKDTSELIVTEQIDLLMQDQSYWGTVLLSSK